jgi:2-iminobutanoate/2-iminopropanoate deaminase
MKIISTGNAPKAAGPYSQAVRAENFLFLSGQIALDPVSGQLINGTFEAEVEQVLDNLQAILMSEGLTFNHVIETVIFLTDLTFFQIVNRIYEKRMGGHKPARATLGVSALPLGARVEIKMTACYK